MKQIQILISILACVFLASCEERTGYYDTDQKEIINLLTGVEWKQTYEYRPDFEPTEYREEGRIYKFNVNGTGSYKWANWNDETIKGDLVYFRWTFTTDNFTVIYIDKSEQFWLIDKLTPSELSVTSAFQDPVLYPNTDKIVCRFTPLR